MPRFEPPNPIYPVARQADIDTGPIAMDNPLTMGPEDEAALLAAWAADSLSMKRQPDFILTQLHHAIGENPTYLNRAVLDRVAARRNAFRTPELQDGLKAHPASVVARPPCFAKVAVPDLCTA